ncbi:MurR/RpiR family transcriptional regulator [Mycoplasma sp. CB776]
MNNKLFTNKELEKLTSTEKSLINFALENPKEFYSSSIKQIALKTFISISLISKTVKKVGFNSLKDMQFYVFHNYLNSNQTINTNENDQNVKILNKLFNYYRESIFQTAHLVNLEEVNLLVRDIIKSQKIYLFGAGSSFLSASELGINLQKIGLNALPFKDFHSFLLVSGQEKNEKITIILFSKSCDTKEIKHIIKVFQEQKIKFYLITANKTTKEQYENVIIYHTLEQDKRLVSISSKINQQFIADLIFLLLIEHKNQNYDQIYLKNLKILEGWNK